MSDRRRCPDGWKVLRFADIAESVTERVDDPLSAGVDAYVGLEHLDSGTLKISRWGSPSDVGSTKLRFYPGDVIYARRRAYQRKLGVAEFEGICSAHALVLRARHDVCIPEFLPYFLLSDQFHARALDISVGSLSPTINWKALAVQEFVLPSPSEQERITEVLAEIDSNAQSVEDVIAAVDGLIDAFIDEAISQATVKWTQLGDVLAEPLSNGITIEPTTEDTGYRGLTIGSVKNTGFAEEGITSIRKPSNADKGLVRVGDLFVTRSNTIERVGLPASYPGTQVEHLYYSDLLVRIRPNQYDLPSVFLERYLRSVKARSFIRSIAAGTSASMKKINGANLRKLPVPLLGSDSLDSVMSKLNSVDNLRASCLIESKNLRSLRTCILESYMRGDLHVQ